MIKNESGEDQEKKVSPEINTACACAEAYEREFLLCGTTTAFAIYIQLCLPLINRQCRRTIRELCCPLSHTDATYLPTNKYITDKKKKCAWVCIVFLHYVAKYMLILACT